MWRKIIVAPNNQTSHRMERMTEKLIYLATQKTIQGLLTKTSRIKMTKCCKLTKDPYKKKKFLHKRNSVYIYLPL